LLLCNAFALTAALCKSLGACVLEKVGSFNMYAQRYMIHNSLLNAGVHRTVRRPVTETSYLVSRHKAASGSKNPMMRELADPFGTVQVKKAPTQAKCQLLTRDTFQMLSSQPATSSRAPPQIALPAPSTRSS
jgi:hypothetical protein